jgi:sRNA-binding regulator protein Hfq
MAQAPKLVDIPLVPVSSAAAPGRKPVPGLPPEPVWAEPRKLVQMVFVLEDGEQVRGVIEWYDRETIKVRNSTRTLIFKRAIKYLYKDGELQG